MKSNFPINPTEIIALMALKNTPHIGDVTAKKLIAHLGSPSAVFSQKRSAIERIDGIGKAILSHLLDTKYLKEAEKQWQEMSDNGINFCVYNQPDYPLNLAQAVDSPVIFFHKGNIRLQNKKIISVVGTRQITSYGIAFCQKFIEDLLSLKEDLVIVSGYAYGVDITTHKLALENGIQTIACLAHGLDNTYPSVHKKYNEQMLNNGGFITDFPYNSHFDRKNFLSRNRIIAGLADATIVVESAIKGGSLVTADIAFSYDREVFAVPGRTTDIYSAGCNKLIRENKAQILTSADDFLKSMNWDLEEKKPKLVQAQLFVELSVEEEIVYKFLKTNGKENIDVISRQCEIPIYKLSNLLFQMEMKGVIFPLPGKIFSVEIP